MTMTNDTCYYTIIPFWFFQCLTKVGETLIYHQRHFVEEPLQW